MRRFKIACLLCMVLTLAVTPLAYSETVTLRLALRTGQAGVNTYRAVIEEFEAQNPGIKIELENTAAAGFTDKLMVQYASGLAPDVIYVHYTDYPNLVRRGMLYNLDEFIARDQYSLDDFFPITLEHVIDAEKGVMAIPRETSSPAVFYNMDHFDQAGLMYPDGNWDYDEMIAVAHRLTRKDGQGAIQQYGIRAPWGWNHRPTILWSWGGRFFDEDGKFAMHEPEGVAAMQWIADLVYVEQVATIVWGERFSSGKSSIEFMNYWHVQDNLPNTFAWDATAVPVGPAGRYARTATGAHGIMSTTAHPEEAWKFVQFLSSTESLAALSSVGSIIPARRSSVLSPGFLDEPPANRWVFIEMLEYAKVDTLPQEVVDALDLVLDPVWKGQKPASIALEEAGPIINAIMQEIADN